MINDLKELDRFLKICRKQGVTEITYQGVCCTFGEMPQVKTPNSVDDQEEVPTDELTPEQLMFYSVGVKP